MTTIVHSGAATGTRISWDNVLRRSGATVTATAGTASYAHDWRLDRRWSPGSGTQTLTATLPAAEVINHMWIIGHNLSSDGATIKLEYDDSGAWTEAIAAFTPSSDEMVWVDFSAASPNKVRAIVDGTAPEIAQIFIGDYLTMQEAVSGDWTPPKHGVSEDITEFRNENGLPIGRNKRTRPQQGTMTFENLGHEWVRDHFLDFRDHAVEYPFGLMWSAENYPAEVAVAWTDELRDISFQRRDFQGFSWPIRMVYQ